MHRLGHVGRTEIDYDFSWRGRACHSEALVVQNFRDFFLNRFAFESEVDEAGASDVRLLANFCNVETADDRVRYFAWIFTALFPENERSVALVIAKARISRWRHVASRRKAGRCKRLGKFSRELRLKYFHRVLIVAASLCEARRCGGRPVACASPTARVSAFSADGLPPIELGLWLPQSVALPVQFSQTHIW